MALSVAKPKPQPKLVVVNNYGMQGSTYNPQPASTKPIQGSSYNPQPASTKPIQGSTYNPQQAAAAAAAIAKQAALVEAERVRTVLRVQTQAKLDNNTAANKQQILSTVSNPGWKGKIVLGQKMKLPKIVLPEQSEYEKAYAAAYNKALADVSGKTKIGKQNVAQKLWDKVSFGSDRRQSDAREYAAKQAQAVVDKSTKTYQGNLNGFLKTQAQKKAAVEGAKYLTQAQFDRAAAEYNAWQTSEIAKLEKQRASTNAMIDAYGKASQAPLTSAAAKGASMFNRNVVNGVPGKVLGNVWQYTRGQGSKNAPSIVTAPGRAVNWFGNLNTKDRTIYQQGGTSTNRAGSKLNAWQATQNQRSFNQKPWVDMKPGKQADQVLGTEVRSLIAARKEIAKTDPNYDKRKLDYDYVMKQRLAGYNQEHKHWNSFIDVAADPLNLAGGAGAGARALGLTGKISEAAKATKLVGWLNKAADTASKNKVISWLGAEHKSPTQKLGEAIDAAKATQGDAQAALIRLNEINHQLAAKAGVKLDTFVFDDLKGLSDTEAKVLQRMVDAKLTTRDRLLLAGKGYAPVREKLEGIARKWQDFSEQMRLADKVQTTRFGLGKKTYSPHTTWIQRNGKTLDEYNFRLQRKFKGQQSSKDLYQGAVDRYFKSNVDEVFSSKATAKSARLKAERDALRKQYDEATAPQRAAIEAAYEKLPWYLRKDTLPAKAARTVADNTPNKLWKKSVLKYRPAWYVNNELYNTQAAVLAGGGRALWEKGRMLSPRYFKKAMDEAPEEVASNISKEIGTKGRLNRFATRQENWSRVAAYRAAKAKGLTDEQAIKRVNRYLFDYKTKNWERPIKAVVPFWQFQKNVAKSAAVMPFDRPLAAEGYHRLDTYQQQQFNKDFDTTVPELKKLGYTDAEIEKFRADNAKFYKGRLKIGGKYITTPFNAFSEKQMSQLGFNPYLAAAGETADSVDSFGKKVKGQDASWWRRLASKFPQVDLGIQAKQALDVQAGRSKPDATWIGLPGHEGYGLTKQKQGFDKSKPNYVASMDPRAKLGSKALSFVGKPSSMSFDKDKFVTGKRLQKATQSYFASDWDKITKEKGYAETQKQQTALFKKYGLTADGFYKGILAKYDSDATKAIKQQKSDAANANKSLFAEYGAQPKGTRNLWATQKLKQLVDSGYFDKNPFLKSFDWITPTTVAKADKQKLVQDAVRSGDWSKYQAKFGKTQKQKDYELASKTGDWSAWGKKYGFKKSSPYKADGKFFKTAESMAKYKAHAFWEKYYAADKAGQKQLLAANPEFDTRKNWTAAMWQADKSAKKAKLKSDALGINGFGNKVAWNKMTAEQIATRFLAKQGKSYKRVKWAVASK